MKYDVITIGSAVRDTFLFLDPADAPVIANPANDAQRQKLIALEYGAKIDVVRSVRTVGGGGINTATTFARMGLKVAAVSTIGDDAEGARVASVLRHEGIAANFIQHNPNLPTGFSTLIVAGEKKRDRAVLVVRGASDSNNFSSRARNITKTKWYYTSALSGKHWKKELRDISSAARSHDISWAWNPGSAQLRAGLSVLRPFMRACSVFNVNRDEALELTGEKNDIKKLLSLLLRQGPERVIISDGINGVYYADATRMLVMRADTSIKALEATGAGDAFGAGFVAGLIERGDAEYALDAGIANSESVICKVGAQEGILSKQQLAAAITKRKHKLEYV